MPAVPRDWADPFLEQAREDLRAAWAVSWKDTPSTFCMLLQMVFEKLGKAAFARRGNAVPHDHLAASHFLAALMRDPSVTALLPNDSVRGFIRQLELAHPQSAGKKTAPCGAIQKPQWPQLEYPWEDPATGVVLYPARDLPLAQRVQDPDDLIAFHCLKFASALEKQLWTILP